MIRSALSNIKVTILSSNGTDLTPSIQILHSNISPSPLQQRSYTSNPILGCALTDEYTSQSWCQRAVSPQDFVTLCKESPEEGRPDPQEHIEFSEGRCDSEEICVGSESGNDDDTPRQAYCVSTTRFVHIGHDESSTNGRNPGSSGSVAANINPTFSHNKPGSHLAVQAVVTNVGKRTSVFAKSMVMQAQSQDGSLWRTVANGSSYCVRCTSVTLAPFPATAQRVKVDVVLPEQISAGLVWLASYSY